jgi:hypothetical protein
MGQWNRYGVPPSGHSIASRAISISTSRGIRILAVSIKFVVFESLSETVEQAVSQGRACIGSIAVVSSDLGSAAEAAAHSIHRAPFRSQHQGDKWIAADYAVSTFDILTSISFGVNVPNMSPRATPNCGGSNG